MNDTSTAAPVESMLASLLPGYSGVRLDPRTLTRDEVDARCVRLERLNDELARSCERLSHQSARHADDAEYYKLRLARTMDELRAAEEEIGAMRALLAEARNLLLGEPKWPHVKGVAERIAAQLSAGAEPQIGVASHG